MKKTFLQLSYELLTTAPEVADLVDGVHRIENASAAPQQFTVLPDGYFKLILTREPGQPPRLTLSGIWTHSFPIVVAAHATVVGIRFRPLVAEYLLSHPVPCNAAVAMPLAGWLYETLQAPELEEVGRRVAAGLALLRPDVRKRTLFSLLTQSEGAMPVAELAAETNWSARQINRYFQARFGLSLKAYSNVLRSFAAARQLRPDDLFAAGGYYDQSHGIRELKKHTGASPRQLDQHRHDRFIQLCPPEDAELCPP